MNKYKWYLWFESSCGKDVFDKEHPECLIFSSPTHPSDDPINPCHAQSVVENFMSYEAGDQGYEDNDYEIVYVEDELGQRFKIEVTVRIEVEWDSEGWAVEEVDEKENLEDLGQMTLGID